MSRMTLLLAVALLATLACRTVPGQDVRYEPTPMAVVRTMLKLASVGARDVVYDLGSGDGRIPITAAKEFGARGVGVEIDPVLVERAQANAREAGVADKVEFKLGTMYEADLRSATVVTLFLHPKPNLKLRPKLRSELQPGARIVSYIWNMGDWVPDETRRVNRRPIFLWRTPPGSRSNDSSPRQVTDAGIPEVWTFDRLDRIGGHPTTVMGNPRVVDTPIGKAIEFDGMDDALFVDVHPLAGAKTFTWEAIFRPDGGNREQRWFHLQEAGSENRMLFEIRVAGEQWFLDSYNFSTTGNRALMNRNSLHPLGAWYHVAAVYDGKVFSNYVNGVQEGSAAIELSPQRPGRSSIGVRINLVDYFKGAIHSARFTRRALPPAEFVKVPAATVR